MSQADQSVNSVSQWISDLKTDDSAAANKLWHRYYERLVRLAARKLGGAPRRAADEEDVVQSAFNSFCQRARQNRFPNLHDRDELWHLLVKITERKAYNQLRAAKRLKRGGGCVAGESALESPDASSDQGGLNQVAGNDPTPEFAACMTEAVEGLLGQLDDELRSIALWKLEGYTNEEIATRIGRVVPTVERRLRMIRSLWSAEKD